MPEDFEKYDDDIPFYKGMDDEELPAMDAEQILDNLSYFDLNDEYLR